MLQYALKRMRWFEKLKLFFMQKRYARALAKMDRAVKKAHEYETRMYKYDTLVHDYIQAMQMKYA